MKQKIIIFGIIIMGLITGASTAYFLKNPKIKNKLTCEDSNNNDHFEKSAIDIKKGQIWEFSSSDNPFKKDDEIRFKVLDVKGDYVQYRIVGLPNKRSHSKIYFRKGTRCVENCD